MIGYFFVADILGFGNIVRNLNEDDLMSRINSWTTLVDYIANQHDIDDIQLISDTVFAFTESSTAGLRKLIEFSRSLLNQGVEQSLPIRGAITHGDFDWGRLTYGKAVITAHEIETCQNWIGVSCDNNLPHVEDQWGFDSLIAYPTPMKAGPVKIRPVVDWSVPIKELVKYLMGGGLTLEGEVIQWALMEKLNNTVQFSVYKSLIKQYESDPDKFYGISSMEVISHSLEHSPV